MERVSDTDKHIYNLTLAFIVFLVLRYTLAKFFTGKPIEIREMVVLSLFYAFAYVIMKKYGKSYYRRDEKRFHRVIQGM